MVKQEYITTVERERCRKVADAFVELYELEEIAVADVGRFGFVKLQYYDPAYGFNSVVTFVNSREMFDMLWQDWFYRQLLRLTEGTPMAELEYEEIYERLPKEKQDEFMKKKRYFAEKAGVDIS